MQRYGLVSMAEDGTITVMSTLVIDGSYSERKAIVKPGDAKYAETKDSYPGSLKPGKSLHFVMTQDRRIEYTEAKED